MQGPCSIFARVTFFSTRVATLIVFKLYLQALGHSSWFYALNPSCWHVLDIFNCVKESKTSSKTKLTKGNLSKALKHLLESENSNNLTPKKLVSNDDSSIVDIVSPPASTGISPLNNFSIVRDRKKVKTFAKKVLFKVKKFAKKVRKKLFSR